MMLWATALVFHKMMKKLESINIIKISDLETLINKMKFISLVVLIILIF